MASIDKSYIDDSDDGSISTNSLEYIRDRSQIHPELNARYARFKIRDHNKQTKNEWKGAELPERSMG